MANAARKGRMSRPLNILTSIALLATLPAWGQTYKKVNARDSVAIKKQIETFYSWYIGLIKSSQVNNDFNPVFARRSDGMTTLDFTKYRQGLKKHNFTDNFIERKVKDYEPCVENLGRINYETFVKFEDLDQFEEINCAFSNVYEWIAGMEPHDGAELLSLKVVDKKTIVGTVQFFSVNVNGQKYLWNYKQAVVTFLKDGKAWRINDLRIERLKN